MSTGTLRVGNFPGSWHMKLMQKSFDFHILVHRLDTGQRGLLKANGNLHPKQLEIAGTDPNMISDAIMIATLISFAD